MTRRMILPLLFGLAGVAVLVSLGLWQVQRMQWKAGILAQIEARIGADPVALPAAPDAARDGYLPVTATGRFTGDALDVLVSRKEIGAGFRVIGAFDTGERRVMIDRGFVVDEAQGAGHAASAQVTVTGNVHWPDETDSFTPAPGDGMWFARDVPAMAAALGTDPVLIVARSPTGDGIDPMPVDASGVPDNHFGYAVQWFLLAGVWAGMTGLYLWRIRRKTD
jgi:surfeit locus 1 family protein